MKKTLITALVLASLTGGVAQASSYKPIPDETRKQITDTLGAQGYEVRKIEMEDGEIEVYALKDGQKYELYLNPDLTIARTKIDD